MVMTKGETAKNSSYRNRTASNKYERDACQQLRASLYSQRVLDMNLPTYDCIRYPRSLGSV
jgi:hypothetical protein